MKIHGIKDMTGRQLNEELAAGGKFVVYQWCISLIIVTFMRPSAVYFVRGDENAVVKGLPFTLLSLVAGWWGIPWGPIGTVQAAAKNLQGGIDVTPDVMRTLSQAVRRSK